MPLLSWAETCRRTNEQIIQCNSLVLFLFEYANYLDLQHFNVTTISPTNLWSVKCMPTCLHCEKDDESANIQMRKESTRYTCSAREQCKEWNSTLNRKMKQYINS